MATRGFLSLFFFALIFALPAFSRLLQTQAKRPTVGKWFFAGTDSQRDAIFVHLLRKCQVQRNYMCIDEQPF